MNITNASPLALFAAALGCGTTNPRENVAPELETPSFETLRQSGAFELRKYDDTIVARTFVTGSRDQASRNGFRIIGGYIFGDNQRKQDVAMTAPVQATPQEKTRTSQTITMTAPVTAALTDEETWEIAFVMPREFSLESLPTPNDARVDIHAVKGRCRAAVVFDGFTDEDAVREQTTALLDWLNQEKLIATSAPTLARYNDPLTLPWNRRNEIIVDVVSGDCSVAAHDETSPSTSNESMRRR